MITLVIVEDPTGMVYPMEDVPAEFGALWAEAYPDDVVMLLIPECVFCGLDICPAEKTVDADWMHVNGWYACDMAKMFAGIKIVQPYDLSVVATRKEDDSITAEDLHRLRLKTCVETWPDASDGDYNPACCRFPKSCSPHGYIEAVRAGNLTRDDLED